MRGQSLHRELLDKAKKLGFETKTNDQRDFQVVRDFLSKTKKVESDLDEDLGEPTETEEESEDDVDDEELFKGPKKRKQVVRQPRKKKVAEKVI